MKFFIKIKVSELDELQPGMAVVHAIIEEFDTPIFLCVLSKNELDQKRNEYINYFEWFRNKYTK